MTDQPVPRRSGILLDHRDLRVRPQDDLFRHTNGAWIDSTTIPDDRGRYGTFDLLREQSDARVRALVEEAGEDAEAPPGTPRRQIGDLYRAFMDTRRVQELGHSPLREDLDRIESISSVAELLSLTGRLQREGISGPLAVWVAPDADDPQRYVLYVQQDGLGMPDEAYYREEGHEQVRAAYLGHLARLLQLVGVGDGSSEPGSAAGRVMALETRIAAAHWDNVTTRDAVKAYNPHTVPQLVELAPDLPWTAYIEGLRAEAAFEQGVVLRQPSVVTELGQALLEVPLEDWKAWLVVRLATAYAPLLDQAMVDEHFAFHGHVISGLPQQRERWKRGVSVVEASLGEAVGQMYAERHFPPAAKERMLHLVDTLLEAFRRSFADLDWMGEHTRAQALAKLETFRPKVGYPDRWRDYRALEIDADLVGSVRRADAFEHDRQLAKIGQPIDRDEWMMLPQTVNAYYHPVLNEIVFPAGILQPPFFDLEADDAVNYGGIGAVIGHEIGHGFDDQGSRYDATGALRDWWTEQDRARFEERTQALIAQFDALPSATVPDQHIRGALTVGENIGDLGGLAIGYAAYRIACEGKPMPVLDGLTGPQRFYLGWAQVWMGVARPEEAARLLAVDPHSPTEARANAARNCDAFHDAFDVQPGDGMWLAPDERIRIF